MRREWFWWKRHEEESSSGVDETRHTLQPVEYEDYATDSRLSAMLPSGHVHVGEWCAKCVEHGVAEQVRRERES